MSILNQLTVEKNKITPYILAILATAAVVYQAVKQPAVIEKERVKVVTKTVDKIVYKDRVKVIKEIITKPDGTKVEREVRDESKSGSNTRKDEKTTDNTSITIRRLPDYSLSILCDIRRCSDITSYNAVAGFRLGQLPVNLEFGGGINGILIGVRYDF